jgi:phosphatidate cytidylyltransferase
MLGQRIVTAIGLVIVLTVVLLLPPNLAIVALAALILIGAWEWTLLAGIRAMPLRVAFVAASAAAMAAAWRATEAPADFELAMKLTMLGWLPLFGWVVLAPRRKLALLAALAGLWALVPTWLALSRLFFQDGNGRELVIFALVLAWAADIGAYFAGRQFGRFRLAPTVSPNKTWEGVLGGLAAGVLVAIAARAWFELPALAFVSLCVAAVLVSVVGDLLESMFKRQRGLKDSGSLLPGHGGVLDRIDSLTSSVPLLALGLGWLGLVA